MNRRLKRTLKDIIGLLLLPVCAGAVVALLALVSHLPWSRSEALLWFVLGALGGAAMFAMGMKPLRLYVLGHELTHALFVWLSRGRVREIRVFGKSGYVKTDKINFLISLAPYYFPFYTMGLFIVFETARFFYPTLSDYFCPYVFLLGFSLVFHLGFTFYVVAKDQDDLKYNGNVFSLTTIFIVNILILGTIVSVPVRDYTPVLFWKTFLMKSVGGYAQIWAFCRKLLESL